MKLSHIITTLLLVTAGFAQESVSGKIIMNSKSMSDNKEMVHLMRFQGIEYFKVQFKGAELNNKRYTIVAKEFWNGKLSKTDTVMNTNVFSYIGKVQGDTVNMTVIASKADKKHLKMKFMFDRFELNEVYKCLPSDDYSLRDYGASAFVNIEPGQPFYAFAYILPHEDEDGGKQWCAVEVSGKDIETWGKEFGIKHYILFEMKFFE
ncbi:hypothetical protein AAEO56_15595 [Flavobacterium sp. DGU11]|uniref:GLPGLI family protein n=1 Tax=Flavobacterium arundinis TaxID=3139143 RepID=A0ABU9I0E8_9FLAO